MQCEREITRITCDRRANGDQFGAVRERAFDMHLADDIGHARLNLAAAKQFAADLHQFGHRMPAVADQLEDHRRNQGDGLGIVELQAACEAPLRRARGMRAHDQAAEPDEDFRGGLRVGS